MKSCHNCPHYPPRPGIAWEDSPCSHCTSTRAETRRQSRKITSPGRVAAPSPDEFIARQAVLAWTHITRKYPAAAAYILAKMSDQSLSYAAIARKFQVSASTVRYQMSLAFMSEPELIGLISVDHTRNRRKAYRKKAT